MTCLAVIPARGGSKRIPKKNVRELGGRPLIAYTIEAALGSGVFQRVWADATWLAPSSSDSLEIADAHIEGIFALPCPTRNSPLVISLLTPPATFDRGTDCLLASVSRGA